MESQYLEEFISGFCKAQNQARTLLCEIEILEDGSRKLLSSDCAYGRCEHTRTCRLMQSVTSHSQFRQRV